METIGTINEMLRRSEFNLMGGKIYLPDVTQENGFELLSFKDPRLDEPIDVTSELCHFFAIDPINFYCFGIMEGLRLPVSIFVPKENLETVQINVDTLNTNWARKEFLRDQDILIGDWPMGQLAPSLGLKIFAGLKHFGIYCVARSESSAFNLLVEQLSVYAPHAFHHYRKNPLANHWIHCGSAAIMNSIKRDLGSLEKRGK